MKISSLFTCFKRSSQVFREEICIKKVRKNATPQKSIRHHRGSEILTAPHGLARSPALRFVSTNKEIAGSPQRRPKSARSVFAKASGSPRLVHLEIASCASKAVPSAECATMQREPRAEAAQNFQITKLLDDGLPGLPLR